MKTKKYLQTIWIFLASVLLFATLVLPLLQKLPKPVQAVEEKANTLNGMTVEQIASMQQYDGRAYDLVPAVKDQGSSNLCWAYSSSNVAEISVLRSGITPNATKDTLSFNPKYLGCSVFERGTDPLKNSTGVRYLGNWQTSPGSFLYTADSFAQWCAPIEMKETANSNTWYTKSSYRLTNALEYSYHDGNADTLIPIMKRAIAEYGAVAAGITYTGNRIEYYNPKYMNGGIGHAITVIGWDDTIDKNLFQPQAANRNGAWIVKNSYSNDPFFYVSYESTFTQFMALQFAPKEAYTYNYFYDGVGSKSDDTIGGNQPTNINKASNVFEAKGGSTGVAEYVQAVNVHLPQRNTICKVQVYTNLTDSSNPTSGTLVAEKTETFEIGGYRTVQLGTPVPVKRGSYFAVVVDVSATAGAKITFSKQIGQHSFSCSSYGDWSKLKQGIPRIKAYTTTMQDDSVVANDISNPDDTTITMPYTSIAYNGIPPKPIPTVVHKGVTLTVNQDFVVSYEYNDRPGTVNVYIDGINNYYGNQLTVFKIEKGSTPTIALNTIDTVQINDRLRQYTHLLPSNWQWQNPDLILDGNVTTVVAEYVGNDKDYYNNTVHTVTILYRQNTTPSLPIDPTPPPVDPVVPQPPVDPTPPLPDNPTPPDSSIGGDIGNKPPINNGNTGQDNSQVDVIQKPIQKNNLLWISVGIGVGLILILALVVLFLVMQKGKRERNIRAKSRYVQRPFKKK